MAPGLVFNNKILTFSSGELRGARLLCVEMIETRPAGNYLSVFRDF